MVQGYREKGNFSYIKDRVQVYSSNDFLRHLTPTQTTTARNAITIKSNAIQRLKNL